MGQPNLGGVCADELTDELTQMQNLTNLNAAPKDADTMPAGSPVESEITSAPVADAMDVEQTQPYVVPLAHPRSMSGFEVTRAQGDSVSMLQLGILLQEEEGRGMPVASVQWDFYCCVVFKQINLKLYHTRSNFNFGRALKQNLASLD